MKRFAPLLLILIVGCGGSSFQDLKAKYDIERDKLEQIEEQLKEVGTQLEEADSIKGLSDRVGAKDRNSDNLASAIFKRDTIDSDKIRNEHIRDLKEKHSKLQNEWDTQAIFTKQAERDLEDAR